MNEIGNYETTSVYNIDRLLRRIEFFLYRIWQETRKMTRVAEAPSEWISDGERQRRIEAFRSEREKKLYQLLSAFKELCDGLANIELSGLHRT